MIAKLANKPHSHRDVNFFHAYTSLKLSNDTPVCRATNLCPWWYPPVTVLTPDFLGNPEIPKNVLYPPPLPEPAKTAHSGWCRGAGCDGAAYVARQKTHADGETVGLRCPRCSTWTVESRKLSRFSPFPSRTPPNSCSSDVQHSRAWRGFWCFFEVPDEENWTFC